MFRVGRGLYRALVLSAALCGLPAAGQPRPDSLSPDADVARLGEHPEWRALLHYPSGGRRNGARSFVDDPRFFLSPRGTADPRAELDATLALLKSGASDACRFVARRDWLVANSPWLAAALPPLHCPEYDEWRRILAADRVWLVYASSFLNSPSSMYGHTFFRFDSANPERRTPLLSYAVNFGATIPADENGFVYAWRGLFGGYPGFFAAGPYFEKLREYSRLENRDLWEYRLALTPAELDRLLAHLWELRDIRFDYYFFDENCSLRLLELLDIARPGAGLADDFPVYAIPIDTVRAVTDAGMVDGVEYRPATLSVFRHDTRSLDGHERRLVVRLVEQDETPSLVQLEALDPARQRIVAGAAYDLLRYRAVHARTTPRLARRNFELLQLLNAVSMEDEPPLRQAPQPPAPERGHRTALVAAGAGIEESRAFGDLEVRLSYHDLLDAPDGYPHGASLNMGRFVVRHREGGTLQLQRFDALEITSLAPRDPFFRSLSWRVNTGLDRQWTGGDDVLVPQVNAGVGWAWEPGTGVGFHLMLTGRIEHNHVMDRELDFAPGITAGLRASGRFGVTLLGLDRYVFTDGVDRTVLGLGHDWPLRRDLALRVQAARSVTDTDRVDEVVLSLRHFF